mgnify:CR=1 FL=1
MKHFHGLIATAVAVLVVAAVLRPPRVSTVIDAGREGPSGVPNGAAPAAATPRGRSSSCTGTITRTASPDNLRDCEQSTVNVQLDTACSVCPGGINLIVIQLAEADDHIWMRESSYRLMDELTRYTMRQKNPIPIRVAVVQYNAMYGRTRVRLTEWMASVRGALAQVGPSGGTPRQFQGKIEQAVGAARSLLRDEHRRQNLGDDDHLCDYALLFALGSQEYPFYGQRMISGARALIGDGVTVMVGCPSGDDAACYFPRLMPRERRLYAEPPDRNAFARMIGWEFRDYDKPYTLREINGNNKVRLIFKSPGFEI